MASTIDNLRAEFEGMSLNAKKQFISKLQEQLEGRSIPSYARLLNECIEIYDAEYSTFVAGIHASIMAGGSAASADGSVASAGRSAVSGSGSTASAGRAAVTGSGSTASASRAAVTGSGSATSASRAAVTGGDPATSADEPAVPIADGRVNTGTKAKKQRKPLSRKTLIMIAKAFALSVGAAVLVIAGIAIANRISFRFGLSSGASRDSTMETIVVNPFDSYTVYMPAEFGVADYGALTGAKEKSSLSAEGSSALSTEGSNAPSTEEGSALSTEGSNALSTNASHIYKYDDVDTERLITYDAVLREACGFEGGLAADSPSPSPDDVLHGGATLLYTKEYQGRMIRVTVKCDVEAGLEVAMSW